MYAIICLTNFTTPVFSKTLIINWPSFRIYLAFFFFFDCKKNKIQGYFARLLVLSRDNRLEWCVCFFYLSIFHLCFVLWNTEWAGPAATAQGHWWVQWTSSQSQTFYAPPWLLKEREETMYEFLDTLYDIKGETWKCCHLLSFQKFNWSKVTVKTFIMYKQLLFQMFFF